MQVMANAKSKIENITPLHHVKGTTFSGSFFFEEAGVKQDLTGWTCRLQMRRYETRIITTVDRNVITTDVDNLNFVYTLSASEMDVDAGKYVVAGELVETATGKTAEAMLILDVSADWVY